MADFPMDPYRLARVISIALPYWPGDCHGIAEAVLRRAPIPGMRLCRGHYNGHVHRDSVYRSAGTQQHSWLVLGDGRILDPTRWTMSSPKKPFIYCGVNDHYDEAGLELRMRVQPQISLHQMIAGDGHGAIDVILAKITAAPGAAVDTLLRCGDIPACNGAIDRHCAQRILDRLNDPVEHHRDPEGFFLAARDLGLCAFAPVDLVQRVLHPERSHVCIGVNRFFEPPPLEAQSDMQKLFRVFSQFLSIDDRDIRIEAELEEVGLSLDKLHDALNQMESCLKFDPELDWMPRDARNDLALAASEILGRGFGMTLRVERFSASLGLDRDRLHLALKSFGDKVGYDLPWLVGDDADRAEKKTETCSEYPNF